jgi:hypothetical protein
MERKDFLLTTGEQIKDFIQLMRKTPENWAYLSRVCKLLDKIPPGHTYLIDRYCTNTENLEKFIKSVCLYIDTWPSLRIEFTNDMTGIRRKGQ